MKYSCNLSSEEFRQHKATVIANIKTQLIQKEELKDGFAYTFNYNDKTFDELINFIKVERTCCSFYHFNLALKNDKIILSITGSHEAKVFLENEIEL